MWFCSLPKISWKAREISLNNIMWVGSDSYLYLFLLFILPPLILFSCHYAFSTLRIFSIDQLNPRHCFVLSLYKFLTTFIFSIAALNNLSFTKCDKSQVHAYKSRQPVPDNRHTTEQWGWCAHKGLVYFFQCPFSNHSLNNWRSVLFEETLYMGERTRGLVG